MIKGSASYYISYMRTLVPGCYSVKQYSPLKESDVRHQAFRKPSWLWASPQVPLAPNENHGLASRAISVSTGLGHGLHPSNNVHNSLNLSQMTS